MRWNMKKIRQPIIDFLRKVNIQKRLVVTFSLTILIPTLIIAWSNYFSYISYIEEMSLKNLEFVTNISSQIFQSELQKYEEVTLELNKNKTLFTYLDAMHNESLEQKREAEKYISQILFNSAKDFTYISNLQIITSERQFSQINAMGYMKGAYIQDLQAYNQQKKMQRVKALKGYPIWFDTTDENYVFYTQRNPTATISDYLTLMRGMIDPESKAHVATIVMNVDIRFIKSAMHFNTFISDGNILFVSEKGPLASLNENLSAPKINDFDQMMEKIKRAQENQKYTLQTPTSIMFFKKLPQTEYYIVQMVDRHDLIKEALWVRNKNLIILLFCICFALSIAYVVTQSIAKPLSQLGYVMGSTREHQLPQAYDDTGKDEVTQLGHHYNQMLQEIRDLIDELYVTEIKKNDAKLNALQMQINPHFIYNTLDFMRWEAMDMTENDNNLSRMINDFSKLLRLSIKKGVDIVSIEEELLHAKTYVKVANYRSKNPIELIINQHTGDFKLPKLTLQPLIENTIIHGFKEDNKENHILIKIEQQENQVQIQVIDDGVGMDEKRIKEFNAGLNASERQISSIGLHNVNQRIKLYYGNTYGLSLHKLFAKGLTVQIRIPLQKGSEKNV